MVSKKTTVINKSGLHARPAADFVKAAKAYKAKIRVSCGENEERKEANAKSIVSVLSLCATMGTVITISAEGENEALAVDDLVQLVESGFGE